MSAIYFLTSKSREVLLIISTLVFVFLAIKEAISNIDGKLQLLAMVLAKEITVEEIGEQIEAPSWEEKG